jgi:glyoxylase-like metal-dependent hydrolase (beta-lactamase superfamily II)
VKAGLSGIVQERYAHAMLLAREGGTVSIMKWSGLFVLVAALFGAVHAQAMTGDKAEFKKLADGVYAFVGKLNDANAMAIVTNQGVVVVDTGNNPPETRILQKFIQSVTTQPVRFVVITQNHGDHTGGTPLFSPPATVIVQDRVAKAWAAMKDYQIKAWRQRFPERTEALKTVNPLDTVVSFSDRMTLHIGGRTSASCMPALSAISAGIPISAPTTVTARPGECSSSLKY